KPSSKHVFLYAFDLLELDGQDLRRELLETRKATLASLLRGSLPGLRLNEHLAHDGEGVFRHACKVYAWNTWRGENPNVVPDLSGANLYGANLSGANISGAYLSHAHLYRANLSTANLTAANLMEANINQANLSGADLRRANLIEADLTGGALGGPDF